MRPPRPVALVLVLVLGIGTACASDASDPSEGTSPSPVRWPTDGWPSATPESEGYDSLGLADALEGAADVGRIHSLLIVREGMVVVDAYVYPYDGSIYHDLASVTKSVVTTLIGIAATQDRLDLDAPIASFFPGRDIANLDERKERITVRHLLTMSSGLACTDAQNEITLQQMRESSDWTQFVLDLEVVAEPGTRFSYCSPGMHLLSAILRQATGMSALESARESLFTPLGIHDVYWPSDPQGVTHGWGDLALKPQDAAKLGYLYLQGGEWNGQRILSPEWVTEATKSQISSDRSEDYGYGWWVSSPGDGIGFFRADGNGGQHILVAPSLDLVVVTTGGGFSASDLFSSVVPAKPFPANPDGVRRLQAVVAELARSPEPEPVPPLPEAAREISGRTYLFEPGGLGVRSVRLDFDDADEATFWLDLASEPTPRVDLVGLDGVYRPSLEGRPIVACGFWDRARTFVVEVEEGPGFNAYDIRLTFTGRTVRLEAVGVTAEGRTRSSARAA